MKALNTSRDCLQIALRLHKSKNITNCKNAGKSLQNLLNK